MKTFAPLLFVCLIYLASCDKKSEREFDPQIIGVWQNRDTFQGRGPDLDETFLGVSTLQFGKMGVYARTDSTYILKKEKEKEPVSYFRLTGFYNLEADVLFRRDVEETYWEKSLINTLSETTLYREVYSSEYERNEDELILRFTIAPADYPIEVEERYQKVE